MSSNSASEALLAHELGRLISSANIRIEQQRIHIHESSASQHQAKLGKAELTRMCESLKALEACRSRFLHKTEGTRAHFQDGPFGAN
jgi:hypothetical protein